MTSAKLFDIEQEPEAMRARYGPTLFGQQVLVARRLVEAGDLEERDGKVQARKQEAADAGT